LKEEHRFRVFENRVQRKIFGSEKDKVTREWRTLHNEEDDDLYSSPNTCLMIQPGRMRLGGRGQFACMGGRRAA
jgi:hypothetical protein